MFNCSHQSKGGRSRTENPGETQAKEPTCGRHGRDALSQIKKSEC